MTLNHCRQALYVALTCLLVFPLGSEAAAPDRADATVPQARIDAQAAGISSYVLANGFKIILAPFAAAANVRVELVVKSGSLVEGYGETGMAHLLEHMLFKSAGKRESIKSDLTKLGARWNATTSADRTSFFETLSSEPKRVDEAIRIEADRFMRAGFTREDLAAEMTVVRNELERNDSSPSSVLMRAIQHQSFFWHGYGRPTIGARSDIESASFDSLHAFYNKHYRPDNTFLLVSGNFDPQRVLALAGSLFSEAQLPAGPKAASLTRDEPLAVTTRSELSLPAGTTMAFSAWKVPGSYDRQTVALELATSAICSNDWGSLRKTVVLESKAAVSVSCSGWGQSQAGLLIATAAAGKSADAEALSRALHEHVEAAAAKGVSKDQLERARVESTNAFERAGSAHEMFAGLLADAEVSGDWRLAFWRNDAIKAITLEEANSALRTWIVSANRSDALLRHADAAAPPRLPEPVDPAARVQGKDWPKVAKESDPFPKTAAELAKATVAVPLDGNAAQAVLLRRKTQGDLAWLMLGNDYGNETALRGRSTACDMASVLIGYGGGGMSRDQLDAKLEKLRANWGISLGRISIEAPRDNIGAALDILLAAWASPAMPAAEFERLKASMIAGGEATLKDPVSVAYNVLERRFDNYPQNHPRRTLSIEQELAQIQAVTLDDVMACQKEFGGRSHVRLAVVGDFSEEDVKTIWAKVRAVPTASVPYARIPEFDAPAKVDTAPITVAMPSKPNASVGGRAVMPISDGAEDFPALRIAVKILGADTDSRIWRRLRETEGLAYGAGATLMGSSFEARSELSLSASAPSEKAEMALALLQDELARALKDGFTEEEVERAKKTWAEERKTYSEQEPLYAARLAQGMLTGRDFAWMAQYDERIARVTARDAAEALRKHAGSAPIVWVIGKGSQQ